MITLFDCGDKIVINYLFRHGANGDDGAAAAYCLYLFRHGANGDDGAAVDGVASIEDEARDGAATAVWPRLRFGAAVDGAEVRE